MITIDHADLLGWRKKVGVAASPAGGALVVFGGAPTAVLHDVETGAERARLAHHDAVLAAAFSPDGRWLATASGDSGVRVWEVAHPAAPALLRGHVHEVTAVAWHPDSALLASASLDGSVRGWRRDAAGGWTEAWRRRGLAGRPRRLVWLDAAHLAIATDDAPVALDARGADVALDAAVLDAALAPATHGLGTGERVVADGDEVVAVAADGARRVLGAHAAPVTALAVVGDVVISGGADATVRTWGARPGALAVGHVVAGLAAAGDALVIVTLDGVVRCARLGELAPAPPRRPPPAPRWRVALGAPGGDAALSPAGDRVAVTAGDAVIVHALADGAPLARLDAGAGALRVRWSDAVLAARQGGEVAIRCWDARTLAPLGVVGAGCPEHAVVGDRLLTYGYARLDVHALGDGAPRLVASRPTDYRDAHVASPDRALLFVAAMKDRPAELVRLADGETVATCAGATAAAFAPDGARVATCHPDGVVIRTVPELREVARLPAGAVIRVVWSARGDALAFADAADTLVLADRDGHERVRRGRDADGNLRTGYAWPVFTEDGARLVVRATGRPLLVLATADGAEVARLGGHAVDHVGQLVVPGGRRIATHATVSPSQDLVIKLWTPDGAPIATCAGHVGTSWWHVVASPRGGWLCSVSQGDPRPRLWRSDDGAPGGALPGHAGLVRATVFTSDDDAVVTLDDAGTLAAWDVAPAS